MKNADKRVKLITDMGFTRRDAQLIKLSLTGNETKEEARSKIIEEAERIFVSLSIGKSKKCYPFQLIVPWKEAGFNWKDFLNGRNIWDAVLDYIEELIKREA